MRALTRGRLVRIALAFALAGCAGSSATHTSRAAASKPAAALPRNAAVINVSQRATGRAIAPGFLGFSFENNAILPYAGTDPHAINPLFAAADPQPQPGAVPGPPDRRRQHRLGVGAGARRGQARRRAG